MSGTAFRWVKSPDQEIIPNLRKYERDVRVAVHGVAVYWGQLVQNAGRDKKVWKDRTGHARSGLFFAVDGFGFSPMFGEVKVEAKDKMSDSVSISGTPDLLIIAFGHTVFYGKFLELSNGGKHAVVMSTMEENLNELERLLRNSLK